MARLADVTVDCGHAASAARFWAAAVDGYRVAAYDDAELERLRSIGVFDVEDDPSVLVEPDPGRGTAAAAGVPRLWFTNVPEPKQVKNRVHFDLKCSLDRMDAELARLRSLGATVVRDEGREGNRAVVLQDPEGNEFCLFPE